MWRTASIRSELLQVLWAIGPEKGVCLQTAKGCVAGAESAKEPVGDDALALQGVWGLRRR